MMSCAEGLCACRWSGDACAQLWGGENMAYVANECVMAATGHDALGMDGTRKGAAHSHPTPLRELRTMKYPASPTLRALQLVSLAFVYSAPHAVGFRCTIDWADPLNDMLVAATANNTYWTQVGLCMRARRCVQVRALRTCVYVCACACKCMRALICLCSCLRMGLAGRRMVRSGSGAAIGQVSRTASRSRSCSRMAVALAAWCSLRAAWKRMCSMRKLGRGCPSTRCQCRAAEELPATPEWC